MSRVKRKEEKFYAYLSRFIDEALAASELYAQVLASYPASREFIPQLKSHEHAGDELVREIMAELSASFITPFDREDIAALTRNIDCIVDGEEGVCARLEIFDVDWVPSEAVKMGELTLSAVRSLREVFEKLPNFKKDPAPVIEKVVEVRRIENEGDRVYRGGLGNLFASDTAVIDILRWTKLLDKMEETLDFCEAVASTVQGVVIKNA